MEQENAVCPAYEHKFTRRQGEGNIFDGVRLFGRFCCGGCSRAFWLRVVVQGAIAKAELVYMHRRRGRCWIGCIVGMYGHS